MVSIWTVWNINFTFTQVRQWVSDRYWIKTKNMSGDQSPHGFPSLLVEEKILEYMWKKSKPSNVMLNIWNCCKLKFITLGKNLTFININVKLPILPYSSSYFTKMLNEQPLKNFHFYCTRRSVRWFSISKTSNFLHF